MSKNRKDKIEGKGVLVRGAVICIAVAAISFSLISGLAAQGTEDTVKVIVNAPEYVGETFDASIDVDSIADFNSGQFDLSFDAGVVNVTDVADGSLDGETIPVDRWEFVDEDTIRVILDVSGIAGVNGSGNLAKLNFEVVGMGGDRSVLGMDNGLLVNTEAEEIPAEWIDDEIIVGPVRVEVNAPEMAKAGETFVVTVDMDKIADFNIAQFDLLFDSSVVNVRDVEAGEIDGKEIPIDIWDFVDDDTIRVIAELPGDEGVSGSGCLAKISFEVVGKGGDWSVLEISNGKLVNKEAREIAAEWVDDEIVIGSVRVIVNAPGKVKAGESFVATIDVDNIVEFNSGQFDLSFDSGVVSVTDVADGSIDGETIPVDSWAFKDDDTIAVILEIKGIKGVSGSGYLAKISFEVIGEGGDRSVLDISDGMLVDTEAEEIPAQWIDDEVIVAPIQVKVNAPEYVEEGETFEVFIDVDDIENFNAGQFDLTFDHKVVEVKKVTDGSIDDTEIPIAMWDEMDSDTIKVFPELSGDTTVSGSGYLAKITFKVKGDEGDECALNISGKLIKLVEQEGAMKPGKMSVEWIGAEITVGAEEEEEEEAEVEVRVNAPEYVEVEGTFDASIDVDSITEFNSGQFDLSFDSGVVSVTDVADGSIDGETIPADRWEFVDDDTIRVILEVSGIAGVNGSGNLATISFAVVGETGDKSVLDISNGLLVNTEAEKIPAEWIDDEVNVGE